MYKVNYDPTFRDSRVMTPIINNMDTYGDDIYRVFQMIQSYIVSVRDSWFFYYPDTLIASISRGFANNNII